MKYCPNCGSIAEDNAVFCTQCGNHFAPAPQQAAPQQPVYAQQQAAPQQPMYAPQQPMYAPAPQKKNRGVFIALIIVIVLLLAVGGFFAFQYFFSDSDKDDPKPDHETTLSTLAPWNDVDSGLNSDDQVDRPLPSETTPPATNSPETTPSATTPPATNPPVVLGYTKGSIENGYYVNEWANLKIQTSGHWSGLNWDVGTDEAYASYQNASTDCGLILAERYAGYQVAIAFEDLTASNPSISESEYMDIILDGLISVYSSSGIEYSVLSSYWSYNLCGNSYLTGGVSLAAGETSFVQVFLTRKLDDHIIFIALTLPTIESADEILEDFVPVN